MVLVFKESSLLDCKHLKMAAEQTQRRDKKKRENPARQTKKKKPKNPAVKDVKVEELQMNLDKYAESGDG